MRVRRTTAKVFLIGLCAATLLWGGKALAVVIERLEVRQREAEYIVSLAALLDAPMTPVWEILTDYPGFPDLSPSVKESEIVGRLGPTTHRLRTRARVCVLVFCKEIRQVQTLTQVGKRELLIEVDPEESDLAYGQARWLLVRDHGNTRVLFEMRLRPDFWVPPIIGPWAIRRSMQKEARAVCTMLERLAKATRRE